MKMVTWILFRFVVDVAPILMTQLTQALDHSSPPFIHALRATIPRVVAFAGFLLTALTHHLKIILNIIFTA